MWGSGPNDIYAVGLSGAIRHSTGDGTWTSQDSGTSANLTGVWGSGPDDVYVSVNANVVLHSTGDGQWEHQVYDSGYTFRGIWGLDADNIYLVGPGVVPGGGSGWGTPQEVTNAAPMNAIWGSSPTNLYVTGGGAGGSIIFHSDGSGTWQPQSATNATAGDAIWGLDAQHVWLGADFDVLFSTGNGDWTAQLTTPSPRRVMALWGASSEALYACTQGGFIYRSNGHGAWSDAQEIDPSLILTCEAIWGTGSDNVYVGTSLGVYRGVPAAAP